MIVRLIPDFTFFLAFFWHSDGAGMVPLYMDDGCGLYF